MSIARKRAKVKKKSQAARGKKREAGRKKKKRATKKKARAAPGRKKKRGQLAPAKKPRAKKRPSVRTKPPSRPKKKRKKRKVKRKSKIAQIAQAFGVTEQTVALTAFLNQPQVLEQIRDRLVESGLAALKRGMVQTAESVIYGHMIIAEQFGIIDQRARELAVEFNRPLREIYEIIHSPKFGEAAE